jgi:HSP20 family protein
MFIIPFTPSRSPSLISRRVDRLFDANFERFIADTFANTAEDSRLPTLDVAETDAGYQARIDVPGVAKEDVQVSVEGRRVSITAKVQAQADKKEGERVVYRERSTQAFSRTFTLPVEIDSTATTAKLENGVLTLTLPKRGVTAPSQIAIN